MANGGSIEFDIGFNVRGEELKKAAEELRSISTMVPEDIVSDKPIKEVENELIKAKEAAHQLEQAFSSAFNKDLGIVNISKFEQEIQKTGMSLSEIGNRLAGAGEVGTTAFRKMATSILTTNTYVKQTDELISKIATTLGNTLKWNISSSAINSLSRSVQEAWGYTKALDSSLNNIQIVTNKSSEDMKQFAIQANDAAKALGTTTTAYTDAALTFYQQGLSDEDVAARAETSLKVSNVTGLSGDQSAEYVTAVLNGYKVAAEDAENAMDKLAAVGAHTASSLAELSEAMAKVASSANAMGVSEDQLAATLATVISVTRQDASTVGTAFKTIYARISDIKAGSEEAEISLGNYTKKMAEMGFSVLDSAGNMRDLGEVMEEIGGKWETLTKEQQISLAQTMAGTRQYNNLIALFDNWAQYEDALNVSMEANGTLQQQQSIYAESLTAKLNSLKTAKEDVFDSLIDSDSMKEMIDGLTAIVNKIADFVDAVGGGGVILKQLGFIMIQVFNKQIANSIATFAKNIKGAFQNLQNEAAQIRLAESLKGTDDVVINKLLAGYQQVQPYLSAMTAEQREQTMELLRQKAEIDAIADSYQKTAQEKQKFLKDKFSIDVDPDKYSAVTQREGKKAINDAYSELNGLVNADELDEVETVQNQVEALTKIAEIENDILDKKAKIADVDSNDVELISKLTREIEEQEYNLNGIAKAQGLEGFDFFNDESKEKIATFVNQWSSEMELGNEEIIKKFKELWKSCIQESQAEAETALEEFNQENTNRRQNANSDSDDAQESLDNIVSGQELENNIQQVSQLVTGIMQVGVAIQQVKQIGSIWSDEDMSVGEKLFATISAISMMLPGFISLIKGAKIAQDLWNASLIASGSASATNAAAEGLIIAAKAGNAAATQRLIGLVGKDTAKKLQEAGATNAEAEAELKDALAKEANAKAGTGLGKSIGALQGGLTKLGTAAMNSSSIISKLATSATKSTGIMGKLATTMGTEAAAGAMVLGAALASVAVVAGTVYLSYKNYQHSLEETAASAKARANESNAVAEAAVEEANKVDELCSSYQNLASQYDGTAKSLDDLRNKTSDLLKEYGRYDLAVKALTADYAELNEIIKGEQITANEEVIKTAEQNINDQTHAVSADVWANVKSSERDEVNGKKSLDLGDKKDTDKLDSVLDKYDIDVLDDFGHIDYDQLIQAAIEGGDEFRADLEAINSDASKRLLEILAQEQDNLNAATESITAKHEAKLENIALEEYNEGDITDVESFNTEVSNMANKAFDAGEFDSYEEAVKWATDYIAKIDELGGKIAGYQALMQQGADNLLPTDLLKSYNQEFEEAQEGIALLEEASGKSIQELIREYGSLDEAMNALVANGSIDSYDKDTTEKLQHVYNSLDFIKSAFGDVELSEEEMFNKLTSDNPLEGAWMDPEKYQDAISEVLQYGLDNSLENIYGFFTPEDWEEILNIDSAEDRITKIDEKIGKYLNDYKDTFSSSTANAIAGDANTLATDAKYYTKDNIDSSAEFQEIQKNTKLIQQMYPEISNALDTINNKELVGTQEWINALGEVEAKMGAISTNDNGIYKDDSGGANVNALETAHANGEISDVDYDNKFVATLEAENKALELDTEAVENYADSLEDMAGEVEGVSEDLKGNTKEALKVSQAITRMNKGLASLKSNYKKISTSLKENKKGTAEYSEAMNDLQDIMGDVLNIDASSLSDGFFESAENLDLMSKAAEGDTDAIEALRIAAATDIVQNCEAYLNGDEDVKARLNELNNMVTNFANENNLEIGASIDDTQFLAACNEMIAASGMTAQQVGDYFQALGYDATVSTQTSTVTTHHKDVHTLNGPNIDNKTYTDEWDSTAEVQVPVVKAMTYTGSAGGTINGSNKKGSSGGGGGGGGGKTPKADKKDFVDPKTDRYHDVEVALKGINNQMEILNDNRKNLTGAELADSYKKELELLDEQINALTKKQKLQKEERKELQSQGRDISRDGKKVHVKSLSEQGVKFDDKGNIANYNEAIVNRTNEYNKMIESYNNLSADRQTDELKAQMDEAKKDYDQFMEDMERYETLTQDEMEETAKEIADALNKKIELKIEKFSMTIDLKLETREAENNLEDFKSKMEHRDKTAAGRTETAANKFKNYMDPETGVQAEIDRVNKIKDDIKKMQSGGHSDVYSEYDEESGTWVDNIAKAQEDLKKYTEQMMDDMENMEDLMDEINQGLLDTFDEIQEGFDDQIAGYDAVADQISHNISLIEKLYGDNVSDKLGEWYDAQLNNSIGKVDMLKKEADFWQKQMENAENDDAYKKAKENWLNSMNELNAAVEDSLDTIIASYENSIDEIFNKMNDKLTGGVGLNFAGEEWELMNENADRYLDTINSTYEVQKLQRKYQTAINNTDNISSQKKLNDLMSQEIKYLEEKDKLSQYDIDRANMKYDIALKQIALEEAQQNKSTLRLKRDSQGNYSYQYAGDEDDISSKQQELADAQNQLYNLDKDAYRQNLDDMYNIYSEFQEKMKEIAKQYGTDSEEYEKYRVLYEKEYGDMINGILADNESIKINLMQSSYDALQNMYDTDKESFSIMTNTNMELFSEMTDDIVQSKLPAIVNGNATSIETMISAMKDEGGFGPTMQLVWSDIQIAAETYQKRVQEISQASGQDLNDLQVNTEKVLITLQGWVEENDKIVQNAETSKAAYDEIAKGIKAMADEYETTKKNANDAATKSTELQKKLNEETWKELEAQTALNNLVVKLKEWNDIKPEVKTFVTNHVDNYSSSGGGGGGGNGGSLSGGSPSGSKTASTPAKRYYAYSASTGKKLSTTGYLSEAAAKRAFPTAKIKTYKTGGYTGTWANGSQEENGRLAFLHQKELVLNENDTANFLEAIKELKTGLNFENLTNAMSSQLMSVQHESLSFQNIISNQLDRILMSIEHLRDTVEQQVHIQAEFQDVRSSQAIIDAMNQLTNRASQMAFNVNRRK